MREKAEKLSSLFRHTPSGKGKRDPSTCSLVTCGFDNDACSPLSSATKCMSDTRCIDGKCTAYADGSECGPSFYCPDDLYCNKTENKCHTRKGEGEACGTYGKECKEGYFCNEIAFSKDTPLCLPNPQKAGDACLWIYDHCPKNTKCADNVCMAYPASVGAKCTEDPGCNGENLTCYNGKCTAAPQKGKKCLNEDCAGEYVCKRNGVCGDPPSEGEECQYFYPVCADGYFCSFGKCHILPEEGEECSFFDGCADGFYCDDETSKCLKYPGEGEECMDLSCGPGLVCDRGYG